MAARSADRATPSCPLGRCGGSGWILAEDGSAHPCDCRERTAKRARASGVASTIPARFRGVSFDRPPVSSMSRTTLAPVREFVASLDENLDAGRGLWLMGDVGTGKTTLAMLISQTALEAGRSVAIYSMPRLLSRIRHTYDPEAGEDSYVQFLDRLAAVDLLHIDDLGAEKRTDWVLEQLYAIVNERYEAERSIVVTTNSQIEDLREEIGPRTVSRLIEMCGDPVPMYGTDHRERSPYTLRPLEDDAEGTSPVPGELGAPGSGLRKAS